MIELLSLHAITPARLAAAVPGCTLAEARKLVAAAHRGEPIAAGAHVRASAAAAVRAAVGARALEVVEETASAIDPFVKYLLAGEDGARFETVRIPLERADRFTVCVSSQVGCALACAFCATGRLGLARNLAAWEIVEQVRIVRARLPARPSGSRVGGGGDEADIDRPRVHGVVFQGMGEPMANLDAVLEAIEVFKDPCALGIDARAITVCTAGLPSGIRRLAREQPKVRLGLSVSSAIPAHRKRVMPIAHAHDFEDVIAACEDHARATGLSPMWAVTLLAGVNDDPDDARALAARARAFREATGRLPRISIVAYNTIGAGDAFARATPEREAAFRAALGDLPSHRRYSGGSDVAAACGQLAATATL